MMSRCQDKANSSPPQRAVSNIRTKVAPGNLHLFPQNGASQAHLPGPRQTSEPSHPPIAPCFSLPANAPASPRLVPSLPANGPLSPRPVRPAALQIPVATSLPLGTSTMYPDSPHARQRRSPDGTVTPAAQKRPQSPRAPWSHPCTPSGAGKKRDGPVLRVGSTHLSTPQRAKAPASGAPSAPVRAISTRGIEGTAPRSRSPGHDALPCYDSATRSAPASPLPRRCQSPVLKSWKQPISSLPAPRQPEPPADTGSPAPPAPEVVLPSGPPPLSPPPSPSPAAAAVAAAAAAAPPQDAPSAPLSSLLTVANSPGMKRQASLRFSDLVRDNLSPSSPPCSLSRDVSQCSSSPSVVRKVSSFSRMYSYGAEKHLKLTDSGVHTVCPKCYRVFGGEITPLTLLCGHSLCTICCSKQIEDDAVCCPSCRHLTALGGQGLAALRTNYALGGLLCLPLEDIQRMTTSEALDNIGATCAMCLEVYSATLPPYLLACGHSMCEKCCTSDIKACPMCRATLEEVNINKPLVKVVEALGDWKHRHPSEVPRS